MGGIVTYYLNLFLALFIVSGVQADDLTNPLGLKRPVGQPLPYDSLVRCYSNRGVLYLEGEDAVNFFQDELSACPDEDELGCFLPYQAHVGKPIRHPKTGVECANIILNFCKDERKEGSRLHETCHWLDYSKDPKAHLARDQVFSELMCFQRIKKNRRFTTHSTRKLCPAFINLQNRYGYSFLQEYLEKNEPGGNNISNEGGGRLSLRDLPPGPADCSAGSCSNNPFFSITDPLLEAKTCRMQGGALVCTPNPNKRPGVVVGPATGGAPAAECELIIGGEVVKKTDCSGNWNKGGSKGGCGYRAGMAVGVGVGIVGSVGQCAVNHWLEGKANAGDICAQDILESQRSHCEIVNNLSMGKTADGEECSLIWSMLYQGVNIEHFMGM